MSRQEIDAREQEWLKAFNSGDASGVANLYDDDARVMAPNAEIVQGRSDIEGFIKGFLETGAKLSFELLTLHEAPELCAAIGVYTMDIPGAPQDRGKYIEVWSRRSGAWRIVDDIFNSSLPAPGSAG